MGGLPLYYFTVQLHLLCGCVCVCVWGGGGGGELEESLLYYILILQSSELTMQDSHASFYSTKTLYHLYISDSF